MVGSEPEFVVSIQTADAEPTLLMPESEQASEDAAATSDAEDEPVARITPAASAVGQDASRRDRPRQRESPPMPG